MNIKRAVQKLLAISAVSVLATTAVAQAARLQTPTQIIKTATGTAIIRPLRLGVPANARVVSARVSIKLGTTTIATNATAKTVNGYGTYRAISTIQYQPRLVSVTPVSPRASKCRVSSRRLVDDRTTLTLGGGVVADYLSGQATVAYTGSCTGYNAAFDPITFTGAWIDDPYIFVDWNGSISRAAAILSDSSVNKIGDIDYPLAFTSSAIYHYFYGATTTLQTWRYVVIKRPG